MSWLERQFGAKDGNQQPADPDRDPQAIKERMSPGLTGEYDWDLREKAGMHQPPAPPEYMGLEGEYDEKGLAKRVAAAFDRDPEIEEIETLEIIQEGSTIILKGSVPNPIILEHLSDVTARVDGTKTVDTSQITIKTS